MKLHLTHRQRQIIKSALMTRYNEWQPNPLDALIGALSKAGIGMSTELVRAYERFRAEYEDSVHRWTNRILSAAGVMPRDLWCLGVEASDEQLEAIGEELGLGGRFPAMITDAQARVILESLQTIRPRRAGKWMTLQESKDVAKFVNNVGTVSKPIAAANRGKP